MILALTSKAIVTLHASLDANDAAVRLRAATVVLEYARELAGDQDLAEDVQELKEWRQTQEMHHGQGSAYPGHPAASGNGCRP
jgi:hypothetical protein